MPSYDYECLRCKIEFELFHSMSDDTPKKCPNCNSKKTKKLISGAGAVIIKGTKTPCKQTGQRKKLKKLGSNKDEVPFWRSRKDGKINKDIMKNPQKYIETGEV